MGKDVDGLVEQFNLAKEHGRGVDMARLKKELGALGVNERGKSLTGPAEAESKPAAAESRAAAAEAGDSDESKSSAPKGRTSGRERQSKT